VTGGDTYTFDARNHLTAISGSITASFVYDGFGRRQRKVVNGATTQFLYDGLNEVQLLDGSVPPVVQSNLLNGLNVDEHFKKAAMTVLTDALGSTLALVNSSGAIADSYEPFGKSTASGTATTTFQFTGRENDFSGLYYYRARYMPRNQSFIGPREVLHLSCKDSRNSERERPVRPI
jgi:YD repeat-containing protein